MIIVTLFTLAACSPSNEERAKNAITVEEYRSKLMQCKYEGKDAGSLSVYQRCADKVDIEYGLTDGGTNANH